MKGKAVTVHDNTFMGPRICTRCGGNVDFGQPCQECLAWYYDAAPKFDEMTDEERATEILSWEFAEIGFDLTYLRIEELLGRELFKHELYYECGGVETLALEARNGVKLGMLGVFAKILLLPEEETVPIFIDRDQEKIAEHLKKYPELTRRSTIVLMEELQRANIDFEVVNFRPSHDFLVKASSPEFNIDSFIEELKSGLVPRVSTDDGPISDG